MARARAIPAAARPLLEWTLALGTYREIYCKVRSGGEEPFETRALRVLDITSQVADADVEHIPAAGPVIVAANHPHGILDGLYWPPPCAAGGRTCAS